MTDPNEKLEPVTSDPLIMSGQPCIRGTRIPAQAVRDFAPQGVDTIKREYPSLTDRQIADALAYNTRPASDGGLVEAAYREGFCKGAYRNSVMPPKGTEVSKAWQESKALTALQGDADPTPAIIDQIITAYKAAGPIWWLTDKDLEHVPSDKRDALHDRVGEIVIGQLKHVKAQLSGGADGGWEGSYNDTAMRDLAESIRPIAPTASDVVDVRDIEWLKELAAEADEDWAANNQPVEQGGPGFAGGSPGNSPAHRILAALATATERDGVRDIATAPIDEDVLVLGFHEDDPDSTEPRWFIGFRTDMQPHLWWLAGTMDNITAEGWMPLPRALRTQEKGDE